jgi:hypothetical protein
MIPHHTTSPVVIPMVSPLRFSFNLTPSMESEASPALVTMHPFQSIIEEVTTPMPFMVKPTLPKKSDAPSSHVINIPSLPPSEQERCILPPNTLSPNSSEVPFDWDDLIGHPIPPPMSVLLRDIIRTITETMYSVSTFSSSTWRALGFLKLLLVICRILTFSRRPGQVP